MSNLNQSALSSNVLSMGTCATTPLPTYAAAHPSDDLQTFPEPTGNPLSVQRGIMLGIAIEAVVFVGIYCAWKLLIH